MQTTAKARSGLRRVYISNSSRFGDEPLKGGGGSRHFGGAAPPYSTNGFKTGACGRGMLTMSSVERWQFSEPGGSHQSKTVPRRSDAHLQTLRGPGEYHVARPNTSPAATITGRHRPPPDGPQSNDLLYLLPPTIGRTSQRLFGATSESRLAAPDKVPSSAACEEAARARQKLHRAGPNGGGELSAEERSCLARDALADHENGAHTYMVREPRVSEPPHTLPHLSGITPTTTCAVKR